MNRTYVATILLVVIMVTITVFQSAESKTEILALGANKASIQLNMKRNSAQIVDASHRLVYHCRMVVLESLLIAKKSVNIALDAAIESL